MQAFDRRRTKEEKDLAHRMKPFSRFHSQEQHEQLVNSLAEELRITNQLATFQEYRRIGITTLLEAEKFEVEKKKRESEKANQKQRAKASSLYSTGKATNRRHSGSRGGKEGETAVGPGAKGHDKLLPEEQALCGALRLPPLEYLIVKCALQQCSLEQEGVSREECCDGIKLEAHKTEKIYDLLLQQGDVRLPGPGRKPEPDTLAPGFLAAFGD